MTALPQNLTCLYPFSHNHGSGISGTWGPEDDFGVPFSTSMIMGGRVYIGLSPFPVIVEMKVYRDSLLKM